MTLTEFLLARIAEDERKWGNPAFLRLSGPELSALVLKTRAECEAKRRIVEWHQNWPVLVEMPPTFEDSASDDLASMAFRVSKRMAWLTEKEYRGRFGTEPPTGPILRFLATPYADHPDYDEEWAL